MSKNTNNASINAAAALEAVVAAHAVAMTAPATSASVVAARPYLAKSIDELTALAATDANGVANELRFRMQKRATAGKPIFPKVRALAKSLNLPEIGTDWQKPVSKSAPAVSVAMVEPNSKATRKQIDAALKATSPAQKAAVLAFIESL